MALNSVERHLFSKSKVLGACDEQFKIAEELTIHLRFPCLRNKISQICPKGFLVYGSPGTGKSSFVRELAKKCNVAIISVCAAELMFAKRSEMGRQMQGLFTQAVKCAPCILLLDDLDVIASKKVLKQSELRQCILASINFFLDELNNPNILIAGTVKQISEIEPSLLRTGRLDQHIEMKVPDEYGRLEILKIVTRNLKMNPEISLSLIAGLTPNFVGSDVRALVQKAEAIAQIRSSTENGKHISVVDFCDFEKALSRMEITLSASAVDQSRFNEALQELESKTVR